MNTAVLLQNQIELFYDLLATRLGEDRVTPEAQMTKLDDEVSEVLEALTDGADAEAIVNELADVVIVCSMMARTLDVPATDLMRAVNRKMETNLSRTWYPTASGTARHTPEEVTA